MSDDPHESRLVVTRDGSHTVYSEQFDQHYHNPNGAVAESRYVFYEKSGLLEDLQVNVPLTIFETGFGTGLNLMLLLDYYLEAEMDSPVHYYSVEGFPLDYELSREFNFAGHLKHPEVIPEVTTLFKDLKPGMNKYTILDHVEVHLFYGMFDDLPVTNIGADYIFHDAFSPEVNLELWTGEVFEALHSLAAQKAILSTYCAASKARGAMAWGGWKVARERGALGKREMTLASPSTERLGDRKRVNEQRLARRYEEGDF